MITTTFKQINNFENNRFFKPETLTQKKSLASLLEHDYKFCSSVEYKEPEYFSIENCRVQRTGHTGDVPNNLGPI